MFRQTSNCREKQPLTHAKQKWRFLGLYDAFRLVENVRFHLEISFRSATLPTEGPLCTVNHSAKPTHQEKFEQLK